MSRQSRLPAACILLAIVAVLLPATAAADPFPVANTADSGGGSLRAAIEAANLHAGPDSIPISATGTINLDSALPSITEAVDITGPGQSALTVRRNAAAPFRIFDIVEAAVSISGITIANGLAEKGAGINATGSLTLTRVTVTHNEAVAAGGQFPEAQGGGIFSRGPATIRESTVSGNTATAGNGTGGTAATGGGAMVGGGSLIDRSTVNGNTAQATSAAGEVLALGAGIFFGGDLDVVEESTVSGNAATAGGGLTPPMAIGGGLGGEGLTVIGSTVTDNSVSSTATSVGANLGFFLEILILDTIVSKPRGNGVSCSPPATSAGFNIDDGSSCGFTQPTDRSNTDPGLDPNLAANGGPTLTQALLPGSVAIDHGSAFGATTDQRGLARPRDLMAIANAGGGDGSDIGAFEVQALAAAPPDTIAPNTRIDHGPAHLTRKRLAKFRFSSTESGSRFECELDGGRFKGCASPFKRKVRRGSRHVLGVRAIDAAGNVDKTPATYSWRVKRAARAR